MTMITKQTLLFVSGLLLFPAHGFLPKPFTAAPLEQMRRYPRASVAFALPSSSRLFFAPKTDDIESDDDKPFIRPALHNSPAFRSLAVLSALLFAVYQISGSTSSAAPEALRKIGQHLTLPPRAAATVHLLSFATWFGTVVYTTFVAGITMFKNLPRRVFGKLQSKLFPLYFRLCSVLIGVQVRSALHSSCRLLMLYFFAFRALMDTHFNADPHHHCHARHCQQNL